MNEIMIEARGITKSYGQVTVLSGVDLDIEKHKITSISGASGAGKTTLLQILGTLNAPDAGSLTIGGTRVDGLKGQCAFSVPKPAHRIHFSVSSVVTRIHRG